MTEDEQAEARERHRVQQMTHVQIKNSKVTHKDGLRTEDIFSGTLLVPLLENSLDAIGRMDVHRQPERIRLIRRHQRR